MNKLAPFNPPKSLLNSSIIRNNTQMNPKYQQAFNMGQELMNRFPSTDPLYEKGRKILAWACERNRKESKVQLFFPPKVGSMDEKIEFETSQPDYYL